MSTRVYLIEGSLKKRQEILDKIRESLDSYVERRISSKDDVTDILHEITQMGCFSEQIFIIDSLPSFKEEKDSTKSRTKVLSLFQKYIPIIPVGNIVVFNNLGISGKKFLDVVRENGKVIEYQQKVSINDAANFISAHFAKNDQVIDFEVARMLPEAISGVFAKDVDVDRLRVLLKKLDMYVGKRKSIKKDDIFIVCADISQDYLIWNLFDYLDKKDFEGAMQFSREYFYRDSSNKTGELMKNIYLILSRYKMLLLMRNMFVDQGINKKENVVSSLLELKKIKTTGKSSKMKMEVQMDGKEAATAFSDKMIYKLMAGGKNSPIALYTTEQLNLIIYALSQALLKIRIGCYDSEMDIMFEFILMTICGKIKKRETLKILDYHKKCMVERTWEK